MVSNYKLLIYELNDSLPYIQIDEFMGGQMGRWMDSWMDSWIAGWMDGWWIRRRRWIR